MTSLTSLIERIEAATEGSRELDGSIYIAVNIPPEKTGRIDQIDGCVGWWPKGAPYVSAIEVPRYSTSVDAALTLLPEGKCWRLAHGHLVGCTSAVAEVMERGFGTKLSLAEAATPALALLAAILRARQTEGR